MQILSICLLSSFVSAQYISVSTNYSKEQLVRDFFLGANNSSCIDISNISIEGWEGSFNQKSFGYFNQNGSSFPLEDGIILSTGKANDAPGPKTFLQDFYESGWDGDQDLINILRESGQNTNNILNATYLEFDFVSNLTEQISFDYMFLSEEYQTNNCQYSDAFAFLIKKADGSESYKNIALVPGTNTPVTSTTINGATNCPRNIDYFGGFIGLESPNSSPTNFNGQTKVLKAVANVEKGVKYHIKLVIADHGDRNGRYDSAVMLKGGSFTGNVDLGKDWLISTQNALCLNETRILDATTLDATNYIFSKDGNEIQNSTDPKLSINEAGFYEVEIKLKNGCSVFSNLTVEQYPNPVFKTKEFEVCDYYLTGDFEENLQNYIEEIVANYNQFKIDFYNNLTDAYSESNQIFNIKFLTSENEKTIYIRLQSANCTPIIEPIKFIKNGLSIANTISTIEICDVDLSNDEEIILSDYNLLIASSLDGSPHFFENEDDAKKNQNYLTPNQIINSDQTFWVRFKQIGLCDNITSISFNFKQPKRSETLVDQIICKGDVTNLDAGSGFDSYRWLYDNSTNQTLENVPAGIYLVELEFNGCIYTQEVKITEAEDPIIQSIDIQASTITINVTGGTPPYSYSLDGGTYQNSNIFTNVTLGNHIIYVKSGDCLPVSMNFSLIQVANFISPNGDGINDVLNLSELKNKDNPSLKIYNRYGLLLFIGTEKNNFTWDGKVNGIPLETGSYWYSIEWTEPNTTRKVSINNSILLRNK